MERIESAPKFDYQILIGMGFLIAISIIVLRPIAPSIFPVYFLYLFLGIVFLFIFSQLDFDILSLFSTHFYIGSIILLILPLLIGQVTRGAIRWIPIGPLTIQPAEIVRPFLLVFFANFLTGEEVTTKRLIKGFFLVLLPILLIVIAPSLGVAILTGVGFLGVLLASTIKKKYFLIGILIIAVLIPIFWQILAPYQKSRIISFLNPESDPLGSGYNSIQAMISVGSGKIFGRGLGKGVQTQLAFLPERHTDFIFAAVSEELGFVGAGLLILGSFFVLFRLTTFLERAISPASRAYISGLFTVLFIQTFIHVGMNVGLLPITGVPYPLVSAGGSSLIATMIGLGIALGAIRR